MEKTPLIKECGQKTKLKGNVMRINTDYDISISDVEINDGDNLDELFGFESGDEDFEYADTEFKSDNYPYWINNFVFEDYDEGELASLSKGIPPTAHDPKHGLASKYKNRKKAMAPVANTGNIDTTKTSKPSSSKPESGKTEASQVANQMGLTYLGWSHFENETNGDSYVENKGKLYLIKDDASFEYVPLKHVGPAGVGKGGENIGKSIPVNDKPQHGKNPAGGKSRAWAFGILRLSWQRYNTTTHTNKRRIPCHQEKD